MSRFPVRFLLALGAAALLSACTVAGAAVHSASTSAGMQLMSFMPTAQQVMPPSGFIDFCLRNRKDCEGGTDTPVTPKLTGARWSELNAVNNHVNKLPQVSDQDRYGKKEYWTYADARGGDCEDLALEKRRLLIEKGWPAEALLLTTVREWNGAGHAVLVVETDRGEYVLDNKNWAIVAWKDAPYTWNKRQSRERPYVWVDLDPHTFKTATPMKLPPLGAPLPFSAANETASLK